MSEHIPRSPRPTVRLPFDFGDQVYHRAKTEKVPGSVVGYKIYPGNLIQVCVRWGNDLCVCEHWLFELSSEYIPDFSQES